MTAPIRWGILSTGNIAQKFVEDLRLLPDAEVAAVGSRSSENARAFADAHDIPRAHGSWQELAEDPDLDVIYVATPHSAHREATLLCLRAGRAALTEKPMALDVAQTEDLVEAARSRGVFLMEALWTRCFPAIHQIAGLVADGAIGRVTAVHADFGISGPFAADHRLRNPALGGGALLDLGVYPVTFAQLFLGAPDEVTAWANRTPEGVDASTGMIFGYASGAFAALTCTMESDTGAHATISGTEGRIELPTPFFIPRGYTLYRRGAEPEVVEMPVPGHGYHYEAAEVQRCLREGLLESPVVPLSETLTVMRTLDTVREKIGVTYP
ncbi:MAG TPA: Gfo/Idh/MocA family oxidoreductase [Micromonosporaceae bacterium]|nr:Gfo/Idh/MocA family oxidoreductase [Micromonosporaceae bacterium]